MNLWTRWRAPTGIVFLDRPLRYVLEYAHTRFFGDLDGALGFNTLNSIGAALEVDSSKYDIIVTRTRQGDLLLDSRLRRARSSARFPGYGPRGCVRLAYLLECSTTGQREV